jgi:probable rRNA maturation factor
VNLVTVIIDDDKWGKIYSFDEWAASLNGLLKAIIKEALGNEAEFFINLLLTNDENICKLNIDFRNKNEPTNILSFPQHEANDIKNYLVGNIRKTDPTLKNSETVIGDIAMSYETIARESVIFNMKFLDRCSHLFVHGVLHLLGMDHQDPLNAEKMESTEIRVLKLFDIRNPYIL